MSYSTIAHALVSYVEGNLGSFSIREMSESFGFSESYLRELFLRNVNMPIMRYCRRRKLIASASWLLHSDKTILEIALESGFSSHESYTRAFQKVFGMPPSRFRLERPPIGRKRLEAGVFGLERLDDKEKRSDESMMQQDEKKTILYGIRKIEWGAYESMTAFPICVKAVSEYLGDDVPYAYIMAATGAAFRLAWNRAAEYFEELAARYGDSEKKLCMDIAGHFRNVSRTAGEMMSLLGGWEDVERMQKQFGDRLIREKLGRLIDAARLEDAKAYEQIKLLYYTDVI